MRRRTIAALALILAVAAGASAGIHPNAGTTALAFLKIGAGARSAAMADAGVALASDATACFWNPARLSAMPGRQAIDVQHNAWIAGTSLDELYYGLAWRRHRLGLSGRLLSTGDIPLRGEFPTERPIAYFQAYDLSAGLSYAFVLNPALSFGATYRRLYEKIYLSSGNGWGIQLGANVNLVKPGVSIGGTVDNLGPRFGINKESFKPPITFRLGASWLLPWTLQQGTVTAAADGVKAIDDNWQARLGAEYLWRGQLALRAGYKLGHDTERFSAGLGLGWRIYKVDYAFVPHSYQLGTSHRFSLGLAF